MSAYAIFQINILVAVLASIGVILAAAYMLWLYKRVVFGKIASSEIKEMVLTDTIQASTEVKKINNIRHISIAPLMGEAIKRINSDSSVSILFSFVFI